MIVELQPDEITINKFIGGMRSTIARCSRVTDAKVGKQNGVEADENGMIAEYAFAKQFNVFPDFGLSPRSGSADGKYKGHRYDIKSTTCKTGRLLCTLKENKDVDIYILAIIDLPTVSFVGWAFSKELRLDENLTDLGHGKGYALTQDKLRKFK